MKMVIFLLMLSSGPALASGWSAPLTVERAFTENSDLIAIYTLEGSVYTPGCSANAWIFRADSETRRSRAWATVLTALTTGQKIQLWYGDSCAVWSYHEAASIMLHKSG
jgi:hypothetical protein